MRRQGLGLAAISYDPVDVLADFSKRREITFPLLSDPGSATIKRYGLLNTTVAPTHATYGIPFPGTFLLDARGEVVGRFFEPAYQERVTVSTIMAGLGRATTGSPATKVVTDHLELLSYATDEVVAPGTHFSVVLDVTPKPRMHVYAPGATGYKVIALTLDPQPHLRLRASQFPPAETYHFKPLNELVQVYQKPFRVVQELTLDPSRDAQEKLKDQQTLTLTGRLDYQACDDKVCFNPVSVPLSWAVRIRPLDRDRVQRRD